jgi:hypothetical protein
MKKQAKTGKETFGLIIGTRAYFNSELAVDVRKTLLEELDKAGYGYVILDEQDTPTGGSMETVEDGKKCAALFRANRDDIDGIIVSLPNFGFEVGIILSVAQSCMYLFLCRLATTKTTKLILIAAVMPSVERYLFVTTCISMEYRLQTQHSIPILYTATC